MGKIYNINLGGNFFEKVTTFIKNNISPDQLISYTVILPNNRSCREFRKCFTWNITDKTIAGIPKIMSISDPILFDDLKVTMIITQIIREKNPQIPINTIFELSESITKLLKNLLLNNVDYTKLRQLVPADLMENWEHTLDILYECINHSEINKILNTATLYLRYFLNSLKKAIIVGVDNPNYFTKKMVQSVLTMKEGMVFISENEGSQNQIFNKEIFGDFLRIDIKKDDNIAAHKEERNLELAEFDNIAEEALAVAISVRFALQNQQKVLIVVPDLNLMLRIKSELTRWNITADDSYGKIFSETPAGLFVTLLLDAISDDFSTRSCLKLLKMSHPQIAINMEFFLRKQKKIYPHFAEAFDEWVKGNVSRETFEQGSRFLELSKHIAFSDKVVFQEKRFTEWSQIIVDFLRSLDMLSFAEEFLSAIQNYSIHFERVGLISFSEYAIFLKKHGLRNSVRSIHGYTPGVIMLGILESQLLDADLIIIAGANESAFTSSESDNFWFSDSMMKALNIPTKDTKDQFIQCIFERLAAKKNVLITRSNRIAGVQQVKYAFIDQLSPKENETLKVFVNKIFDSYQQKYRISDQSTKKLLPYGSPALCYRPRKFSVTDLELLKNNAYAYYCKKILKLDQLAEIDSIKNLRGNYIHTVLDNFIKKRYGNNIKKTAEQTLKDLKIDPSSFGLWFFRIDQLLEFVKDNSSGKSISEIWGERDLAISPAIICQIVCKADRIDIYDDNTISIIDYKTSSTKITSKNVQKGEKIQLIIEAWIAQHDGFKISKLFPSILRKAPKISSVQYWFLRKDCEKLIIGEDLLPSIVEETLTNIRDLLFQYNIEEKPYLLNPQFKFYDEYMHLARLREFLDA